MKKTEIGSSVKLLLEELNHADSKFIEITNSLNDSDVFQWRTFQTPAWKVIEWNIEHERIHHGQIIAYFSLANIQLPQSFKSLWSL